MAQNITTNTDTDFAEAGRNAHQVLVKVTGTWGGTTCIVKVKNGNGEWEQYPTNGSQTADFAYIYTMGDQTGVRLTTSAGSGADLWAQVLDLDQK